MRQKIVDIENYLDKNGVVTLWPSRRRRSVQLKLLSYFATKIELDRSYSEREVNEILRKWHLFDDPALLRREMFELKLITRNLDGTNYRRAEGVQQ